MVVTHQIYFNSRNFRGTNFQWLGQKTLNFIEFTYTMGAKVFFCLVWAQRPPQRRKCRGVIVRQIVRQLVNTILITNNYTSFDLWWKQNLVKQAKVSKYYDHGCLQNFLLRFMSLSTAPVVKNRHVLSVIYFIFLKNVLDKTWKAFNTKFEPQ